MTVEEKMKWLSERGVLTVYKSDRPWSSREWVVLCEIGAMPDSHIERRDRDLSGALSLVIQGVNDYWSTFGHPTGLEVYSFEGWTK